MIPQIECGYMSGKQGNMITRIIKNDDWKLYRCDQTHGTDYLASWGSESKLRKEMAQEVAAGWDVWLINPNGEKHLPTIETSDATTET